MSYLGALIEDLATNVKNINENWNQIKMNLYTQLIIQHLQI